MRHQKDAHAHATGSADKATGAIDGDHDSERQRNPIRGLIVCGLLLIGCVAIGTAVMAFNFRDRALARTNGELESTTLLLARHFEQKLEDFISLQNTLGVQSLFPDASGDDDLRARLSTFNVHLMLQDKVDTISHVGAMNIFDKSGKLINSSSVFPVPDVGVGDRSYFLALKYDPARPVALGEPMISRVTGIWTATLAQRLAGPDGKFFGLVSAGLTPAYFEAFLESIPFGKGAAVSVFHQNGALMARNPATPEAIGHNFGSDPLFQATLRDGRQATMRGTSFISGEDRLGSARVVRNFPIVIVATRTVASALSEWREQTTLLVLAGAVSSVLIAIIFLSIIWRLSKQHEASRQRLDLEKRKLAVEKGRLDTAINHINQGLMLFDADGRLVLCNNRTIEMYGLSRDVMKPGTTLQRVIAHRKETGTFVGDVDEYCKNIVANIGVAPSRLAHTLDGRSIRIINTPIARGGWVALHEDITERMVSERKISHLAHYDALTDLPNRVLFREKLKAALDRMEGGRKCAVLYIDIDEFKSINDSLGHPVGDELLKTIAGRLRGCIRATDVVARLGGDEFAIVRTDVESPDDVETLVSRIFEAIRAPYDCLGHRLASNASIGIAMASESGADLDNLLKNADLAMYAAKSDGRGTHRFFEQAMDERLRARRILENDLRQAISSKQFEENGFEVHYQPLIRFADRKITGCEALLRWRHPLRGMVSPVDFISVAEEIGLINDLGEWVLAKACAEAAIWPGQAKIAVNVSPIQFRNPGFALRVASELVKSGLHPARLELEITEAVLIRDDEATLTALHQLRGLGVRIALDDFGTGYSSLSYLQRFPFDKIKIDRSFVNTIETPEGAAIVQAVVTIAAASHMTTTAEGVETEQQFSILRTMKCDEMQGYLFSPAVPASRLRSLFGAQRAADVA